MPVALINFFIYFICSTCICSAADVRSLVLLDMSFYIIKNITNVLSNKYRTFS